MRSRDVRRSEPSAGPKSLSLLCYRLAAEDNNSDISPGKWNQQLTGQRRALLESRDCG